MPNIFDKNSTKSPKPLTLRVIKYKDSTKLIIFVVWVDEFKRKKKYI
jgi:hypothetical protein